MARRLENSITAAEKRMKLAEPTAQARVDQEISVCLFGIMILCIVVFVALWLREQSNNRWITYLLTDDGLHFAFSTILTTRTSSIQFSSKDFNTAIRQKPCLKLLRPIFGTHLDLGQIAPISDLLLKKLVDRKLIIPLPKRDVYPWYEIKNWM